MIIFCKLNLSSLLKVELIVLHFFFSNADMQKGKVLAISFPIINQPVLFAKHLGSLNQIGSGSAGLLKMPKFT